MQPGSMWAMARITPRYGRSEIRNQCAGLNVFTADLHRLADWLQNRGVRTVDMQSTGVYWIPLYETG
jgi:transposase